MFKSSWSFELNHVYGMTNWSILTITKVVHYMLYVMIENLIEFNFFLKLQKPWFYTNVVAFR
jgi:hypothetical protein